ncbi:hypothetical protein E2C01_018775 [Portunus trituberculatus]|uniref:Uncharacterized protein n=1 Tax=Portunus trituberculatus TaxID=210409 RepID=A0A5B7DXH4_PORTR|nr:hypothetical protein [Portunus trituberculatus]
MCLSGSPGTTPLTRHCLAGRPRHLVQFYITFPTAPSDADTRTHTRTWDRKAFPPSPLRFFSLSSPSPAISIQCFHRNTTRRLDRISDQWQ